MPSQQIVVSMPSPHRIALLFNANKVYDRHVLTGIGQYLTSTRVEWDLFMEEDFRCRTVGIHHWRGDGIIADYDDPANYPEGIPYVATDNAKLVRLAYDHLIDQGLQRFAFYGLPPTPGNRWAMEREQAFLGMTRADNLEGQVFRGSPTSAGCWGIAQEAIVDWVRSLPKPID